MYCPRRSLGGGDGRGGDVEGDTHPNPSRPPVLCVCVDGIDYWMGRAGFVHRLKGWIFGIYQKRCTGTRDTRGQAHRHQQPPLNCHLDCCLRSCERQQAKDTHNID